MKNFLILLVTIFCYVLLTPNASSLIETTLPLKAPKLNIRVMEAKDFAGGRSHLENKAFIGKSSETSRKDMFKEAEEFAKDNNYSCAIIWKDYFVVTWENNNVKKVPAIFVGFMLDCYDKEEYEEQLLLE